MERPDLSAVIPLFLDPAQTRYWEGGQGHDRESAMEMLDRYFRLPSYHWMIFRDSDPAGYGHLLRSDFLEAWIVSYIVAPEHQGQGVATAFVEEARRFALCEGIETLYASVHFENAASIRVVEKSGFEPTDDSANPEQILYRWSTHARKADGQKSQA
ncbi:MAG: GNAT family N-acetyltransferase [Verrucomicrobiota bacterium]